MGYDMPPGVMVALFSNLVGRRKQRKPWEDWLKHVAKNNKREGDWFRDRICPRKLCRDVYLMNTNYEPENAGDAS